MTIVLLGYRGSGKTTLGKRLADRLWQKFVDTDQLITASAGMSIKDIFAKHGEEHFRTLESAAIQQAIKMEDPVIAIGGGAPLREENRAALIAGAAKRIYLKCDPQILHDRIHADPETTATRPSLTHLGGSLEEIKTLLAQREPAYRSLATAELDVSHLTPEEALPYIVRLL